MKDLKMLVQSIPTHHDPDREDAMVDLYSAVSMDSEIVLQDFISKWVLTSQSDLAKMSSEDKAYRQFILEFKGKYDGRH